MAVKLDMVGIVVRDMAAALRFYRLLGLPIPEGKDAEDFVETTLPSGLRISWNSITMMRGIDPDWAEPSGAPIELAFLCGNPAEVDETYSTLTRQGYRGHKEPWDAFWGQRYAIVVDPDGNHISLFASL